MEYAGKSRDLGDGLQQRWLRVYAPGKLIWTDLVRDLIRSGPDLTILWLAVRLPAYRSCLGASVSPRVFDTG